MSYLSTTDDDVGDDDGDDDDYLVCVCIHIQIDGERHIIHMYSISL